MYVCYVWARWGMPGGMRVHACYVCRTGMIDGACVWECNRASVGECKGGVHEYVGMHEVGHTCRHA